MKPTGQQSQSHSLKLRANHWQRLSSASTGWDGGWGGREALGGQSGRERAREQKLGELHPEERFLSPKVTVSGCVCPSPVKQGGSGCRGSRAEGSHQLGVKFPSLTYTLLVL